MPPTRRLWQGAFTIATSLGLILTADWLLARDRQGASAEAKRAEVKTAESQSWPLRGEILSVNDTAKTLLVHHEEIVGFMPAMTMEFRASAGDIAVAKKGQRIRAILTREGEDFVLRQIWPDDEASKLAVEKAAAALAIDTAERKKRFNPFLETGETVPDFTLFDQEGRVVDFARFRGKRVLLNFIYSRCPIATMCPASTAKMQALQKASREQGIQNVELVSVSLDPTYDTPGVLKDYASARGIETSNFSFLTGPEGAVKNLLHQLGILTYFQDGILQHSLSVFLVGPDGKIVHREDGPEWKPEAFLPLLKQP